jgi:hypothetical protein
VVAFGDVTERASNTDRDDGSAAGVRLAPVRGRALDGTEVVLPDDLPGDQTLVVLAFRQRQQPEVDRWIELAVSLGVAATPLGAPRPLRRAVVEVPVLGRRYLAARRFIDGGMATGIGDPAVLARTVTVYTDPIAYRRRCGLGSGEAVRVLLTRRDGRVSFVATGPPGEHHRAELARALDASA